MTFKKHSQIKSNCIFIKFLLLTIILFASSAFSEDVIKIPVLVGQTGASAVFGAEEMKGYTLALEEWNARGGINGKKIELEVEDTQTKQAAIVTAFYRFANNHPSFILGPTWLDGFPAVVPLAEKQGIALITPSAEVEAFGQYTGWPISFHFNSSIEIHSLYKDLKNRKLDEKIALIYEAEPYAEIVRKLLLREEGVNLIEDIGVQGGETDFRASLARLIQKEPSTLIVLVWDESSLLSLLQQIKTYAPNLQLATIHAGESWTKHEIFSPYINQLLYSKFVVVDTSFNSRFEKRFKNIPLLSASTAYDVANNVFTAISSGAKSGKEIHEFLINNELDTVSFGKVRLNAQRGIPTSEVIVEEYKK